MNDNSTMERDKIWRDSDVPVFTGCPVKQEYFSAQPGLFIDAVELAKRWPIQCLLWPTDSMSPTMTNSFQPRSTSAFVFRGR